MKTGSKTKIGNRQGSPGFRTPSNFIVRQQIKNVRSKIKNKSGD